MFENKSTKAPGKAFYVIMVILTVLLGLRAVNGSEAAIVHCSQAFPGACPYGSCFVSAGWSAQGCVIHCNGELACIIHELA